MGGFADALSQVNPDVLKQLQDASQQPQAAPGAVAAPSAAPDQPPAAPSPPSAPSVSSGGNQLGWNAGALSVLPQPSPGTIKGLMTNFLMQSPMIQDFGNKAEAGRQADQKQQLDQQRAQLAQQSTQAQPQAFGANNPLAAPATSNMQAAMAQHGGGVREFLLNRFGMMSKEQRATNKALQSAHFMQTGIEQQNADTSTGLKNLQAQQIQQENQLVLPSPQLAQQYGLDPAKPIPMRMNMAMIAANQRITMGQQRNAISAAGKGYTLDASAPNGIRPMTAEEMPIPQQDKQKLTALQAQIAQERLNAARLDPNTPAGQAAQLQLQSRLTIARALATRAAASMGMTGVAQAKFAMDYVNGFTDDEGNQMGLKQAGVSGALPTANMRTMGQMAKTMQPHLNDMDKAVDSLAAKGELGPIAGRWEGALTGKAGIKNPEMAKMLAEAGLASSAMLRTHFGARGGQEMYKNFVQQLNAAGSDPENIHAVIGVWRDYINGYAAAGVAPTGRFNAPQVGPKGNPLPTTTSRPQAPPATGGGIIQDLINKHKGG